LIRDKVIKIWRLYGCEDFIGKCQELVFDAFNDEIQWRERRTGII